MTERLNWTMPTLMPNGPGTDHTPPRKPLQPLNSGFLIYFLLPPLVNCYPLPYLRVLIIKSFIQFSSVAQLCPTLCNPMNCSTPGLPVHHQLLESTQTHVHWVDDAIQPSYPLSSPSPWAYERTKKKYSLYFCMLTWVSHCSKCFIQINSFASHNWFINYF